jgi:RimJ/RimL family protein N-acetyltransferase
MATPPAIEKVTLQGKHVRLEPLDEALHRIGLAAAINDGELWALPVTVVPHPDDLGGFFADAEAAFAAGHELPFATIDQASGRIAGSTRFRMIDAGNRRAEIGFTFVAASWQRTHVNTEAKLLMLGHAFETWQLNRVELITDARNDRSQTAIRRLGATREGLLRSHMVMRDGFVRDSMVFSIIEPEWPAVRLNLEERLS